MNNEIGTFKRAFEMLGYKNLVVKNSNEKIYTYVFYNCIFL